MASNTTSTDSGFSTTTLDTLASALSTSSKVQMRRIKFAQESAELDTPLGSLERLVNLYIEAAPSQARSNTILRATPGLASIYDLGFAPVWAMNDEMPGFVYAVAGSALIRVGTDGVPRIIGHVGNATASTYSPMVTIAVGPQHVVVCAPPNAYGAKHTDEVLHQITGTEDSPFPGASSVAYLDGYFVFTANENSSQFFSAKLLDPDNFDAFDFAYADATPNVIRRVISFQQRLWFCGESGIEIWYDSGDSDFPFRRDSGGFITFGVRSPRSVAICDGSLFWLGQNGMVLRSDGYKAARVSTHAIERQIHAYTAPVSQPNPLARPDLAVNTAFSHTEDGHPIYSLTLRRDGDAGRTWCYDCATKLWHERSSSLDGNGRWRINCAGYSTALGGTLLGDSGSGLICTPRKDLPADIEILLGRIAISPPLWNNTRRAYMDRLEIECELGGAGIMFDYTDDGGATWKAPRLLTEAGRRVVATRLGSFYHRSLRLQITGTPTIYGIDAQIQSGDA